MGQSRRAKQCSEGKGHALRSAMHMVIGSLSGNGAAPVQSRGGTRAGPDSDLADAELSCEEGASVGTGGGDELA